ncbi:MAG: DUF4978 domain-containing protein [Candidatus Ornithomonoglobus sp.]
MKRILSLFTALSILIISLNISVSAENTAVTGIAETGRYTWNFVSGSASEVYDISDEYADLRVSLGSGDSITSEKGIYFSDSSCKEIPTNAEDSNRYILIKPIYSGTVYITIQFTNATNNAKGRIWYNDFGDETSFDDIDLSILQKGIGTQIGSDFTSTAVQTLSFDVDAGHIYSLHTYNRTSYISELYYTSDDIVGKTKTPTIKTPVVATDTEISGTCVDSADVMVKINNGDAKQATVTGTEWSISGLALIKGDVISVTAKAGDYRESDAVKTTVIANDSICALTINNTVYGMVTSNQTDNGRITKGATVILTVMPDDKYKLSSLTVAGNAVEVDKNNQYSFVINDDTEVTAVFEAKPYHSITMPQETANGSVSIVSGTIDDNGVIKAVEGDRVMMSIKADSGYRIKTLTYTTENGETKEFKYGSFFDMPTSDITINAEFKKEDIVSYVDTSFNTYDRITLMVDDKPFFFNGVQVRPDNAVDQLGFTYDQIREMYLQAGKDGYTVVNSQIRWRDVQPDKAINANETNYVSDENITYITFNNIPQIEDSGEYAAVKLRLYSSADKDTKYTVYGVTDGQIDETSAVISPDWDMVSATADYHSVNVAEFVNEHKNDDSITFAVVPSDGAKITIDRASIPPQLKLSRDDIYDWTHLDKILDYAYEAGVKFELLWFATDTCQQSHEVRVPYYVHENYQKSLKSDGTPARNLGADNNFIMCKNDLNLRAKEKEVLETVFDHIADYTAKKGYGSLVVGCQVANETAVGRLHSGTDEDKYFGHCYCDVCMEKLANSNSEAAFREDTLWEYLNNLSSAVKESKCSVWTRENNYMTTDTNVLAYNEQKRSTTGTDLDFIGLDPYSVTSGADHDYIYSFGHETCTYKNHTYNYAQGKNLPMAMEYGGNNQDLDESIIACIAGGGYLNVYELLSGKEDFGTYVATRDDSGNATGFEARTSYTYASDSPYNWSEENWIDRVRNMNAMLNKAQYQLATKKADGAGGDTLMFFNPKSNETATSTKNIRALDVTYNTDNNGVGIAIEESDKEIVLISTKASEFVVNDVKEYGITSVETGYFSGSEWVKETEKAYTADNDNISVAMDAYECVKITVAESIPKAPVIEAVSGTAEEGKYSWNFGKPVETEGAGTYDYSDKYASIRVATGSGDSLTQEKGLYWSDSSCKETDSAADNNRYILIKPTYSGRVTLKVQFTNASSNAKGRIWYNDLGADKAFDSADLTTLKKGVGTQIGSDVTDTYIKTLSFEVEAGHMYSLHTYNRTSYISEMYYESDDIVIVSYTVEAQQQFSGETYEGEATAAVLNVTASDTIDGISVTYGDTTKKISTQFTNTAVQIGIIVPGLITVDTSTFTVSELN